MDLKSPTLLYMRYLFLYTFFPMLNSGGLVDCNGHCTIVSGLNSDGKGLEGPRLIHNDHVKECIKIEL